jgi:hypothetical protein
LNGDAQRASGSKGPSGNLTSIGERDQVSAVRDEISPQREEALLEAVLRYQMGIDPDRLGPVLDLAAVGIVRLAADDRMVHRSTRKRNDTSGFPWPAWTEPPCATADPPERRCNANGTLAVAASMATSW